MPVARSLQSMAVTASGLTIENKRQGAVHVPWDEVQKMERDTDWLDLIGRPRGAGGSTLGWISIHREMIIDGDLDRFANAVSNFVPAEYV